MKKETLHIYCRVSSTAQEDRGTSLESQKEAGIKKAKELNMIPQIHNEGGKSSRFENFTNRPVLQNLLDNMDAGLVEHLFVQHQDRLSRNQNTWGVIRFKLKTNKITLYTVSGKMDLANPMDNFFFGLMSEMSQLENAKRATRAREGKIKRVQEGYWYGAPPPFGYEVVEKKLSINKFECEWVKKVFNWYLNGVPVKEIKIKLMKNGIKTRRGNSKWSLGSIRSVLKNTHYLGYFDYTDKEMGLTVKGEAPAFIDKTVWDGCQNKRKVNFERRGQRNRTKRFYLLRDFLYCEHCGKPMGARWNEHNNTKVYYCTKNERKWVTDVKPQKCMSRGINIPRTDKLVWETVMNIVRDSCFLKEQTKTLVLDQVYDDRKNFKENNRKEKKKYKKLKKELDKIDNTIVELETRLLLSNETEHQKHLTKKIIRNIKKTKIQHRSHYLVKLLQFNFLNQIFLIVILGEPWNYYRKKKK